MESASPLITSSHSTSDLDLCHPVYDDNGRCQDKRSACNCDKGHPRNAGTFCRILARYVRSQGTLTLLEVIRKMSLMPAQMLQRSTPPARLKGRLQEGANADVVIFDPLTESDRSTYQHPMDASVGVEYLLVGAS